jgi:hypothetical protein
MTLPEYRSSVEQLPYGKRLPTALYVHREGLAGLTGSLGALLDQVVARYQVGAEFNLVKFRTDELKLSFLAYPGFESDPHPALRQAITIDLATGKARRTDYAGNINPPILHRKETFLPAGHRLWTTFRALTRAEEEAGLYEHTATIGFRLNWEKLLTAKGVEIRGHELLRAGRGKQKAEMGAAELADPPSPGGSGAAGCGRQTTGGGPSQASETAVRVEQSCATQWNCTSSRLESGLARLGKRAAHTRSLVRRS